MRSLLTLSLVMLMVAGCGTMPVDVASEQPAPSTEFDGTWNFVGTTDRNSPFVGSTSVAVDIVNNRPTCVFRTLNGVLNKLPTQLSRPTERQLNGIVFNFSAGFLPNVLAEFEEFEDESIIEYTITARELDGLVYSATLEERFLLSEIIINSTGTLEFFDTAPTICE